MTSSTSDKRGTLYLVPTPLGNLGDVTLRAIEVLRRCQAIVAEDTRRTRKLLDRHGIGTRPVSLHRFNETRGAPAVVDMLGSGRDVAYVTDAGTPGVSDPGARLVEIVRQAGFAIIPLPGPCAAVTALSVSGWEGPFVFEGYMERTGRARQEQLGRLAHERRAVILYEAPGRVRNTLADLDRHVPGCRVLLAREMTKIHEEYLLAGPARLMEALPDEPRGEFTLVVMPAGPLDEEPATEGLDEAASHAQELARAGAGLKRACAVLARMTGLGARDIYEAALGHKR